MNPSTATDNNGGPFLLGGAVCKRVSAILDPTHDGAKITVPWNMFSPDGKIAEDEVHKLWSMFVSDLPYAEVASLITTLVSNKRTVSFRFVSLLSLKI
jgi:hypothetical protein